MGGKTWSRDEELYFWRTIVPMSPKAASPVQVGGKLADWEQCACNMQRRFGSAARRKYTKLMLFEHYFQNITTGHKSPRAADLVAEHKRHLEAHGKNVDGIASTGQKARGPRRAAKRNRSAACSGLNVRTQKPRANEAAGDASRTDSSGLDPGAVYAAPAAQVSGPPDYYHGDYYYPGSAAFPQVVWSKAVDSAYVSTASPSSLGGSPGPPPAAVSGGDSTDTIAHARYVAE